MTFMFSHIFILFKYLAYVFALCSDIDKTHSHSKLKFSENALLIKKNSWKQNAMIQINSNMQVIGNIWGLFMRSEGNVRLRFICIFNFTGIMTFNKRLIHATWTKNVVFSTQPYPVHFNENLVGNICLRISIVALWGRFHWKQQ